jgi:hypothetical protein
MRKPEFGEACLGAAVGAVVGAIGGLVAIGIAPAIMEKNPALLLRSPILALMSWIISVPTGWVVGGQLGPRMNAKGVLPALEIAGGVIGGLVPVVLLALFGWLMATG